MADLLKAYVGRPRNAGQWLALALIGLTWPLSLAYAFYWLVRKAIR